MLPFIYFLLDASSIVFSYYLILSFSSITISTESLIIPLGICIIIWTGVSGITKLYFFNLHNGVHSRILSYFKSYVYFSSILFFLRLFLSSTISLPFVSLLYIIVLFILLNCIMNYASIWLISKFRRRAANIKKTLIVGAGSIAIRISNYLLSNPDFGFRIIGYVSMKDEENQVEQKLILSELDNLENFLSNNTIDEIVIALPHKETKSKLIRRIIDAADHLGARVSFVPDYEGLFGKNYKTILDNHLVAVRVNQMPLDEAYPTLEKAVFDFIFSVVVLILLTPFFLFIAICIKIDSQGDVFYCPTRVGRGGRNFRLYKFRTMSDNDTENGGTKSTQKNDPRITPVGRILRKYNLDELPQFLNVLMGDMSVVGPRPHRNYLNEKMKEHVEKYMVRHYFRPGITGWAQVNGWRGPTETEEQITQRSAHDLWYIENWSFSLDLKIVWMTIFARKALENAY
ncbi:MAG TPA: undecaprenyl-phosphate glucose phosphotransferase [Chryseolinea sp.]|nr:undecaprenyl-phosphate glucose phosphotransferase [Chryseolinea sp.]